MSEVRIECVQAAAAGDKPAPDLLLLPGRAALVPATRTLLVADLLLGKAATFRRSVRSREWMG